MSKNLSMLAYANGFTHWHYTTPDTEAEVLAEGYFVPAADMLRKGDWLTISTETKGDSDLIQVLVTKAESINVTVKKI